MCGCLSPLEEEKRTGAASQPPASWHTSLMGKFPMGNQTHSFTWPKTFRLPTTCLCFALLAPASWELSTEEGKRLIFARGWREECLRLPGAMISSTHHRSYSPDATCEDHMRWCTHSTNVRPDTQQATDKRQLLLTLLFQNYLPPQQQAVFLTSEECWDRLAFLNYTILQILILDWKKKVATIIYSLVIRRNFLICKMGIITQVYYLDESENLRHDN